MWWNCVILLTEKWKALPADENPPRPIIQSNLGELIKSKVTNTYFSTYNVQYYAL